MYNTDSEIIKHVVIVLKKVCKKYKLLKLQKEILTKAFKILKELADKIDKLGKGRG